MEISRKMNLATVNNLRKGLKDVKVSAFVARFFGVVSSVAAEPTNSGAAQWKFTGEFQGVSADGKGHGAPVLYLPSPADEVLATAVRAAGSKPVKFGYDLYAEPSTDSVLGYVLKVVPLVEPAALDSLADLKLALPAVPTPPPVPAPAPVDPAPAPAPKPAPKKK